MDEARIITIDGPAGVGKSTIARKTATALGIAYLDTGAMFRTLALHMGHGGLDFSEDRLEGCIGSLVFSLAGSGGETALICNDVVAGQEIRTEDIGMLASRYAALPVVRSWLKKAQQELGRKYSLVAEGRDMGTVVFPDAPHKFFLDASPETRARRRVNQLAESGVVEDLAVVTQRIRERDALDRGRSIAPLRAAEDAVVIDTSALTLEDVFNEIMQRVA